MSISNKQRHVCAILLAGVLLVGSCSSAEPDAETSAATGAISSAVGSVEQDPILANDALDQFADSAQEWVSFADMFVTFRVTGNDEGAVVSSSVPGMQSVAQLLTLEIGEIVWQSPTSPRLPEVVTVRGEGFRYIDDVRHQRHSGGELLQLQGTYAAPLLFVDWADRWAIMTPSSIMWVEDGVVQSDGEFGGLSIGELGQALESTEPHPGVDFSIGSSNARALAYEALQTSGREDEDPNPAPPRIETELSEEEIQKRQLEEQRAAEEALAERRRLDDDADD